MDLVLVLPFAIGFTLFLVLDFTLLHDYSPQQLQELYAYPSLLHHLFFKGNKIFALLALFWLLRHLNSYQKTLKTHFSFIEPLRMQWLKNFTGISIFLYSFSLVGFLIYNFGWIGEIENVYLVFNIGYVLVVLYLSYHGIQQYGLAQFSGELNAVLQGKAGEKSTEKETVEQTQKLSNAKEDHEIQETFARLQRLFESKNLYTEPQLRIGKVSELMGVSTHRLSHVINAASGKPFYEFVNGYRVELLKQKLIDPSNDQFTILALAMDCGFNSKASLNRVFKEQTGQTPSQYKRPPSTPLPLQFRTSWRRILPQRGRSQYPGRPTGQ